jgi:hypothetical protein
MFTHALGIVIAAGIVFMLGALWYSPMMFFGVWSRGTGITDHQTDRKLMLRFFGILGALLLLAACVLDYVVSNWAGGQGLINGITVGFLGGLLATAVVGMNSLFERRSFQLFLVNAGYQMVGFLIMGLILALL